MYIDTEKLRHNIDICSAICRDRGLRLMAVAKGCNSTPGLVDVLLQQGVDNVGVSRVRNARRIHECYGVRPVLMRLPCVDQADAVVRHCCMSYNSMAHTLDALAAAASRLQVRHEACLCMDLGDQREGVTMDEAIDAIRYAAGLENGYFSLRGFAAHYGCLAGRLPRNEDMEFLAGLAQAAEGVIGRKLDHVSIGGSDILEWLGDAKLPPQITELRLGAALLNGNMPVAEPQPALLHGVHKDALLLEAQVLEVRLKHVQPVTHTAPAAFVRPENACEGERMRAVLDCGVVDTDPAGLRCTREGVVFVGANSDYSIFDVSHAGPPLLPGDTLTFAMDYQALARAFHSVNLDVKTWPENARMQARGSDV